MWAHNWSSTIPEISVFNGMKWYVGGFDYVLTHQMDGTKIMQPLFSYAGLSKFITASMQNSCHR